MKRDVWYGRKQFEINYELDKRSNMFSAAMKSAGASMNELSEAFKQLAKI